MRTGAFILLLTLLAVQVRYSIVQFDYLLHQEYIATELCVEKDIAESTCAGKCHMRKEMAKLEMNTSQEQQAPVEIQVVSLEYLSSVLVELVRDYPINITKVWVGPQPLVLPGPSFGVDRPPPEHLS